MDAAKTLKRLWHFIWYEDSLASWIVNVILAFIIVKFIFYPGLGFLLETTHPIVAVVSGSMEHSTNFDDWWNSNKDFYLSLNISKDDFSKFYFKNGFNKGDIMVLLGKKPEDINIGDVVVFRGSLSDPIIHRVVKKFKEDTYYFQTKGDNNSNSRGDELKIDSKEVIGEAIFRVPFIGWVKIWFVKLVETMKGMI